MYLLNARTRRLEFFIGDEVPKYAILSHTGVKDEVSFQDIMTGHSHKIKAKDGFLKIKFSCDQALVDDLGYVWVDNCCIDKTSSAELSEAINSMFNWYARSEVCYAYLADVDCGNADELDWLTVAHFRAAAGSREAGKKLTGAVRLGTSADYTQSL